MPWAPVSSGHERVYLAKERDYYNNLAKGNGSFISSLQDAYLVSDKSSVSKSMTPLPVTLVSGSPWVMFLYLIG
jgi:hypothetical protein